MWSCYVVNGGTFMFRAQSYAHAKALARSCGVAVRSIVRILAWK